MRNKTIQLNAPRVIIVLVVYCFVPAFTLSCQRSDNSEKPEPNTNGSISRLYKKAFFTVKGTECRELSDKLEFVKVENDTTVIMRFKNAGRVMTMKGKVGEYLKSEAGITSYIVLEASPQAQSAVIEYLAWSSYPRMDPKGQ